MKKIWTINWSKATTIEGPRGTAVDTYGTCACAHTEFGDALKALTRCKDSFLADIREEDVQNLMITGSENEEYFEIDFIAEDDSHVQIYIGLNLTELFEPGNVQIIKEGEEYE